MAIVTHGVKQHSCNGTSTTSTSAADEPHVPGKKIWDTVHGYVHLGPVSVQVIDTPQFQRLRNLKQLGITNMVFPTAEHSRFVHSLGVAHLAYTCLDKLRHSQPALDIRGTDLAHIELAGLCHDLGHGPLCHMFQSEFLPRMAPLWDIARHANGDACETFTKWSHEAMSCRLLEHIIDTYSVDLSQEDLRRVEDIIAGRCSSSVEPTGCTRGSGTGWGDQHFMLQIVANMDNGVDVDKIDYLRRDSLSCGVGEFNFTPLLDNMKVIDGHICFADSMQHKLMSLFAARATMHAEVYAHRKAKCFEYMILDALCLAHEQLGLAERTGDLDLYAGLDDTVLAEIEHHPAPDAGMAAAQAILKRLRQRDLYRWCAEAVIPPALFAGWEAITEQDVLACQDHNSGVALLVNDIIVQNLSIHHGRDQDNVLTGVRLFPPGGRSWFPATAAHTFMPASFIHRKVRVYLRKCVEAGERGQCERAVQAAFRRCMRSRLGQDALIVVSAAGAYES